MNLSVSEKWEPFIRTRYRAAGIAPKTKCSLPFARPRHAP